MRGLMMDTPLTLPAVLSHTARPHCCTRDLQPGVGRESNDAFTDDGWFRTGDTVTISPRGNIGIQDREKDLVKSGGGGSAPCRSRHT